MRSPTPQLSRSNLSSIRERLNISRLAIRHAKVTIFCWIAIAVIGLFALSSLKYALFPDITFPVVVVSAKIPAEPSPQADPETTFATTTSALDIESQVAIPLERQLQSIEGLKQIVSSTFPGRSVATLHFRVGESLVQATSAVSDKISQAALSPEIAFEVIPFNLNEATVASYAIFSDQRSLTALADFAETDILPTLRDIPGVLRVDLLGRGTQNAAASDVSAANLQQSPTLIHFDGEQALAVQIVKRGDANTLEVAGAVDSEIQQLQERVSDVDFSLATTQADYIRAATRATIDSLIGAIAIAVLVIFGFLRSWRATLITALAIPLSLLGTCIVMAIFGFNLETITLLALALVIGIIVDDAIVEVENITRHIELGESPKQAALKASEEIGLTVSASTLTIVAVFLPVAFMGGTIGQFFKPFGLTVSAAVLISLLVARTLSPVLAASWLKPTPVPKVSAATVKRFSNNGSGTYAPSSLALPVSNASIPAASISKAERRYSQLLRWALYHRWMVVGMAIACLIAGLTLIPFIPKGFIPQLDRGEFYLNYAIPLPQVPADFNQRALASNAQPLDLPVAPDIPADRPADIPADPRERILQTTLTTAEQLEEKVFQLPEVASVLSTVGGQGKPNEGQLYITLSDDRARDTATVQTQLREELAAIAGVTTSVENVPFVETRGEKPLRVALLGDDLSVLNQTAVDVKAAVENISGLVDVQISGAGNTADEIVEIDRENGQRVAYISANLSSQVALGDATDEVVAIAKSIIPPEVRIDLGSDSARIGEVLGSFSRTLIFAIVCMLGVLFIPFGRLLEPAVVGLSLPLSVVGAVLALLVTQSDFGMVSLLGLLFLLGLLDKNALLLMDYANQLRRAGMTRMDAMMKTGLVRLRPILMTTASTVLGMLPIALGLGAGAELRQPMAVAIIGGLLTSTLLSLVVVPVLYSLLEDGWKALTRQFA